MDKRVQGLWTNALRTGEVGGEKIVQAQGVLEVRRNDIPGALPGMCCLGVLCNLAIEDGVDIKKCVDEFGNVTWYTPLDDGQSPGSYDREIDGGWYQTFSGEIAPKVVSEWAGLSYGQVEVGNPNLTRESDGEVERASAWNDDAGATFTDIADMVDNTFGGNNE